MNVDPRQTSGNAPPARQPAKWELRLYVAGQSARSVTAFANLKKLCEAYLAGRYRIEVIDLLENPQLSRDDQIVAIPTLVRNLPTPRVNPTGFNCRSFAGLFPGNPRRGRGD